MTCPKCQAAVPDQSAFCLACGARLAPEPDPGERQRRRRRPTRRLEPAAGPRRPPGTKQAYALSFGPLVDERLRYRVARWVVERAPAHALAEVQEDLQHGTFVTFLALTADEADAARQGIQGLGVAPALLRLAPATTAQMLLPERRTRPSTRRSARSAWAIGGRSSPPPWGSSSSAWSSCA